MDEGKQADHRAGSNACKADFMRSCNQTLKRSEGELMEVEEAERRSEQSEYDNV